MHIIHSDFKQGIVKLKVDDPEDIWYLSHIIEPADLVTGKTTRKIKLGNSDNAKTSKITLTLQIQAESIEISADGSVLRINGKIKSGPDDIPRESYHSIEIEQNSEFTLQKKQWLVYQKQKLQQASEKSFDYILCVFDREEALVALSKKSGYQILVHLTGEVQKKALLTAVKTDFQREIIGALESYRQRYQPQAIIIASPAFYKEDLSKKINAPELKKLVVLAECSDVSERSLDEVIKRPELAQVLKSSRARTEKLVVDELLGEINKNSAAAYGWEQVQKAVAAGAVRKLLLTDNFIKKKHLSQEYQQLDQVMKQVDERQGEIHILSSEQEAGQKIDGLGGIAAILRYKLPV